MPEARVPSGSDVSEAETKRKCCFGQNRKKVIRLAKSPTARQSNEPHHFAKTRKFQNTPNPYFPPHQPQYGLPSDVPSGRSRAPPPREGCRWAWLGAPGTRRRRRWVAPPVMPIDSRAVAEAPGGGQKDRVTWERSGRPAGHTFHESLSIGNLRLQPTARVVSGHISTNIERNLARLAPLES